MSATVPRVKNLQFTPLESAFVALIRYFLLMQNFHIIDFFQS